MFYIAAASCACLAGIAWYDFKDRSIPVYLLLIELLLVFAFFQYPIILSNLIIVGINILLGILQISLIAFWLKIKRTEFSFFRDAFGWGDFILFIIAAFCFSIPLYICFILLSSLISLLYTGIIKLKNNETTLLIPLAGIMAVLLLIWQIVSFLGFELKDEILLL